MWATLHLNKEILFGIISVKQGAKNGQFSFENLGVFKNVAKQNYAYRHQNNMDIL